MPSELPILGTPSRGTPVRVPRQLIFSSGVMSERRLSMRFSAGRFGSEKGDGGCCATAIASTRTEKQSTATRWFFMIRDSLSISLAGPEMRNAAGLGVQTPKLIKMDEGAMQRK